MSSTVAFLGDSAMWGQGLRAEHQFARLAAEQILGGNGPIRVLPGLGEEPRRGYPRSGAKINPVLGSGSRPKITVKADGRRPPCTPSPTPPLTNLSVGDPTAVRLRIAVDHDVRGRVTVCG